MFKFSIISRMNTRSCSYSKRSILAAVAAAGLTAVQEGVILHVEVPDVDHRRELERQLQLVDRIEVR
jgi:hypothetical protein